MGNSDFKIILQALLDQTSLTEIEKKLAKKKIQLGIDIDFANSIKESEKQVSELAMRFKSLFNFKTDAEAMSFTKKYLLEANALIKQNEQAVLKAERAKQKELDKTIALYNKQQKEREKADASTTKTRTSNANSILAEEIQSLNRIADLRAKIITQKANGNDSQVSVLQQQLSLERQHYNTLMLEASNYTNIISYEERRKVLKNESIQAELKVQQAQAKIIDDANIQAEKAKTAELEKQSRLIAEITSQESAAKRETSIQTLSSSIEKLEGSGTNLDKIKASFSELKAIYETLGSSSAPEEMIANYNKFNTKLLTTNELLKQAKANTSGVVKEVAPLERATFKNQIEAWIRVNSNAKNFISTLEQMLPLLDKADRVEFDNLKRQYKEVDSAAKAAGVMGKSFTDTIKAGIQKFGEWGLATNAFMFPIQKLKEANDELKSINTILTEISKTSERTAKQLKELGDSSFETASKYGNKASNYLIGIQEMSRAGYENSEEMAELSTLAQSAGDMTAELANDYLIASDAAYGYGGNIEKLTALLDGQNQITNRNAVSMEELANATKVAGNMLSNVANIPEKELSALLGTGIATSRESGETVARAMKSIMMNLQQVAGEGGFEGEIIDEESLKKVEARCHSVGVELEYMHDGMVKLRDPMEVLKELADVYNSLPKDSADRAGIISDIGGKYRANVLSSVLSNFDKYEKMLGDYENSAGSAFEEAMKSANNWEGSLNRLSNTWTDIVGNIENSDGIIAGINALNSLLEVVNKLTSALGSIGSLGAISGGILGAKNFGGIKLFVPII